MSKRKVIKSSETGKFVSKQEAAANPSTTFAQEVATGKRSKFLLNMVSGETIEEFRENSQGIGEGFIPVTNIVCIELTKLGEAEDGFFQIFGKRKEGS